jgi:F420-dependent oxidoreductase-like protein
VKIGVHIPDLTYPGGPTALGADLARIAEGADAAGIDRVSVMDHVWQIPNVGPVDHDMLEAYTALGFLAARSSRIKLLTLVTGVTYRDPGLLAKAVTTLDVLSGGRAIFGIGAAWNEEEARGLGLPFAPIAERFERLEETLQIAEQMWSGSEEPYEGRRYHLERTLNVPQPLRRPRPPILIGGGGERKTLRLVARYADACNLFNSEELPHKLDVLKRHCENEGRDYDEIEKTVSYRFDVGPKGENTGRIVEELGRLREMGFTVAHGQVADMEQITPLEIIGNEIVPAVAGL